MEVAIAYLLERCRGRLGGSAAVGETGVGAGAEAGRGLPGERGSVEHSGRGRGTPVARVWGWCWWRRFLKSPSSKNLV